MTSSKSRDVQREFYESGYGGSEDLPEPIIASFSQQSCGSRITRAAELLQGVSGQFIDVGCGGGPLLYLLKDQFATMTGVDIAEVQLNRVRTWSEAVGKQVQLHRCNIDVENLPLADASVDAASCMVVLEFVMRLDFVVSEIVRVLRPNGVFVCSIGNIVSWKNRLRVLFGLDPRTTVFMDAINGGALHYFTKATFIQLLERAGLLVEAVGCSGRWWPLRQHWPALLGGDIIVRAKKL